jgi:hypothetical protein
MANLSKTTRDHEEIRRWAEERGGKPAHVKRTGSKEDIGILRIDFPGFSGEGSLEPISWEEFFDKFDERNLALVYQEETAGGQRSNFNKLVSGETAAASRGGASRSRKSAKKAGKAAKKAGGASRGTAKSRSGAKSARKRSTKKGASKKTTSSKASKKSASKGATRKKSSGSRRAAKRR